MKSHGNGMRLLGVSLLAIPAIGFGAWVILSNLPGPGNSGDAGGHGFQVPDANVTGGHDDGHGDHGASHGGHGGHGTRIVDGRPVDHHGPLVGIDQRGYAVDPLDPDCRGCSPHKHPTPLLTAAEFRRLKAEYAQLPVNEQSEALDTLLFYGPQFAFRLRTEGAEPLDTARAEFAATELSRRGVTIELRVVDEFGVQRVTMPPTFWPFDIKQHYFPKGDELVRMQTPDINGTCKRVGLHHIWVRC